MVRARSRVFQEKIARIGGIVEILVDDLAGLDNLQDFFAPQ
jgi:hypothetical protein